MDAGRNTRQKNHKGKCRKTIYLDLRRCVGVNCDHAHNHQGCRKENEQFHNGEVRITDWVLGRLEGEKSENQRNCVYHREEEYPPGCGSSDGAMRCCETFVGHCSTPFILALLGQGAGPSVTTFLCLDARRAP